MSDDSFPIDRVTFKELDWDSNFFRVKCAKAIIHKPLTQSEWSKLKQNFLNYQFISIENRNSEIINSQYIASDTTAFLADINIQFVKQIAATDKIPGSIKIHHAMQRLEDLVEMSEYKYSKFTEDAEFAKRGGSEVYRQWVINSFGKEGKYFTVAYGNSGAEGYLLHSFLDDTCVVELIAVSDKVSRRGIGTRLFKATEASAFDRGIKKIKVGTQIKNHAALNFYNKMGCKLVGCHQIYHLWNL